jgi:hypothetical protein
MAQVTYKKQADFTYHVQKASRREVPPQRFYKVLLGQAVKLNQSLALSRTC